MSVAGQPPVVAPPEPGVEPGRWRKHALAAGFLAPAAVFLLVWIVYPTLSTIKRSFYDRSNEEFVWFDNYVEMFTNDVIFRSIVNNLLWLAIVPVLVTVIGLIFAVLTERVSWSVAFKTAVFMPMAISAFAAGITWRIVYIKEPDQGALNAGISAAKDAFSESGVLTQARPSTDDVTGTTESGFALEDEVAPGDVALFGLTAIRSGEISPGRRSGGSARAPPGRDHRRRLERLQARRRHARRGRERGGRDTRRDRRPGRGTARRDDQSTVTTEDGRHVRVRGGRGRRVPGLDQLAAPSRNRSPASAGSARSWSHPRS